MPISQLELDEALSLSEQNPNDLELAEAAVTIADAFQFEKQQRQEAARKIFTDDNHGFTPEKLSELNTMVSGDEERKYKLFNQRYFQELGGLPKEQVEANLDQLINAYGLQEYNRPISSHKEFFGAVKSDFLVEDQVAEMAKQLSLTKANPLDAEAQFRQRMSSVPGYAGREQKWSEQFLKFKGVFDSKRDEYAEEILSLSEAFQVPQLVKDENIPLLLPRKNLDAPSNSELADIVMRVPSEDRRFVIGAAVASVAKDESERKSILANFSDSMARGFDKFDEDLGLFGKRMLAAGLTPLSESKAEQDAVNRMYEQADLTTAIRRAVEQEVDPITSDFVAVRGLYGFAQSIPYMAAAAIPGGSLVNTAAFSQVGYDMVKSMNPNMSSQQALGIGLIAAPLMTYIERMQFKGATGQLTSLNRFFNEVITTPGGATSRFLTRTAANVGTQMVQENLQDLTPFMVQGIISAVSEDMPNVPVELLYKDMVAQQPELFFAILPLAVMGGGAGTYSDFRNGRALLSSYDELRAQGLSEAASADIRALAARGDYEGAQSILREEFKTLGKDQKSVQEARAEAFPKLIEEYKAQQAALDSGIELDILPAILQQRDGKVALRYTNGQEVQYDSHAQAMERFDSIASSAVLKLHRDMITAAKMTTSQMDQGREVKLIISPLDLTTTELEEQGVASAEQLEKRKEIADVDKGITPKAEEAKARALTGISANSSEARKAASYVLGSSVNAPAAPDSFGDRVIRTTARVYKQANPYTVIEEVAEGDIKFMLTEGRVERPWIISALRQWESQMGDALFRKSIADDSQVENQDIVEAYSKMVVSYFAGRATAGDQGRIFSKQFRSEIAKALRMDMNAVLTGYASLFEAVYRRAGMIEKARKEGTLPADLESFLAKSAGMSPQKVFEREVVKEGEGIARELQESGTTLSVMTSEIPVNRMRRLMQQIDAMYSTGRTEGVENLEAELEILLDKADSDLEGMDENDDADQVGEMLSSDIAEVDSANPSPEEELINQWYRWTGKGAAYDGEELRETYPTFGAFVRAATGDNAYVVQPGVTDEQIEEAAKESVANYERRRTAMLRSRVDKVTFSTITPAQVTPQGRRHADLEEKFNAGTITAEETAEAQRLVDEKALAAGYDSPKVYHGTQAKFNVFDESKIGSANGRSEGSGFYFTTDKTIAEGYQRNGGNVISAYLKIEKALDYNQKPFTALQIRKLLKAVALTEAKDSFDGNWKDGFLANYGDTYSKSIDSIVSEAAGYFTNEESALDQIGGIVGSGVDPATVNEALSSSLGYDAFYSKGFSGEGKQGGDIYVATRSNQVKSADPFTGVPLDQRFDPTRDEITFSTITPAVDAEYLALAADPEKNQARLQEMVDVVARMAGYDTQTLYHNTNATPEELAKGFSLPAFFTPDIELFSKKGKNKIRVYINRGNEFRPSSQFAQVSPQLMAQGYGRQSEFDTVTNWAGKVVRIDGKPSQIKSADPVTYDESGNIIPLSQRFNPRRDETSFSTITAIGDIDSKFAAMFSPFQRSPELRAKLGLAMREKTIEVETKLLPIIRSFYRTNKDMQREASVREGFEYDRLLRETFGADTPAKQDALPAVDRQAARSDAKRIADQWMQGEMKKKEVAPRETLIGFLRTLDAIQRTLPVEVRGKIGGFVQLAELSTPAAMLEEIERRVKRIDSELEKYLKKEAEVRRKKLFKRAKPKREAGKKPKGKAGADIHDLFDRLAEAMLWDGDQAEAWATMLEAKIAKGELSPEAEAHAAIEANLVRLFSDWNDTYADTGKKGKNGRRIVKLQSRGADAARRTAAIDAAEEVFRAGYLAEQTRIAAERERRAQIRADIIKGTGKLGNRSERAVKAQKDAGLSGQWKEWFLSLFNFDQVLGFAFGAESKWTTWFADQQRTAENQKIDEVQSVLDGLDNLFRTLGGSRLGGEKLQWKLSQPSFETKQGGMMSELEGITAILMWRQEDGKRHMKGKRDENGKITSTWAYDQSFIDEIGRNLSKEGLAVMDYLIQQYAGEYETLNPIFREINGINLPRNSKYSPLSVKPQQAPNGQTVDPVTGSTMSNGSMTPGSLRTRAQVVAEPDFRNAIEVFVGHKKQLAHWKAYAVFVRDAQAILGNREVGNSIEASSGQEAIRVIKSWLDMFAQGGVRDAGSHLALTKALAGATGRAAAIQLVGRVGTLAIQTTQLGAAAAKMPFISYVSRLSKLLTGRLAWGDALNSPYIQRRLAEMPVSIQLAMEGLRAKKPNAIKHAVQRIGRLLSGTDALFTAGTFAIVYDYQLTKAIKAGVDPVTAGEVARNEAERIVDEIAQPTRQGTRSLFEATATNPLGRVSWAFASEARKNMALIAYTGAKRPTKELSRALFYVVAINGILASLIRTAWKDLRNDDEDEDEWSLQRMLLSVATEPLYGFPGFGEIAQDAIFAAAGEWQPSGSILDAPVKVMPAIVRAPENFSMLLEGDLEQPLRDLETILMAGGLFSENIAALSSLSHVIRDAEGLIRNFTQD